MRQQSIATEAKEMRLRLQLSQADIANALGIHVASVSRFEAGKRPLSPQKLEALTAFLKARSVELVAVAVEIATCVLVE